MEGRSCREEEIRVEGRMKERGWRGRAWRKEGARVGDWGGDGREKGGQRCSVPVGGAWV